VETKRRLVELSREESLGRLSGVSFGRIVFTRHALPAIRAVNHLVDNGTVVIRTHLGAAILTSIGTVVAYEADEIDPVEHTGWSVIVTGVAMRVRDAGETTRYEGLLRPWVDGSLDEIIRIRPEIVTGYRLTGHR
jgi:hypothetical protein